MVTPPALSVDSVLLPAFGICCCATVILTTISIPRGWKTASVVVTRIAEISLGCWLAYAALADLGYFISQDQGSQQSVRALETIGVIGFLLMIHGVTPAFWRTPITRSNGSS